MNKREQFDILSRELLGKLNEVNDNSDLFFPFDYKISEEIEEEYFKKGTPLRSYTIGCMITIDNSFKKFQIFPDQDIMTTYIETQRNLLDDWQTDALKRYKKYLDTLKDNKEDVSEEGDETEENHLTDEEIENKCASFKKVLEKIVKEINEASKPAIKETASSDEAKELNGATGHGNFTNFIQNAISNLFK